MLNRGTRKKGQYRLLLVNLHYSGSDELCENDIAMRLKHPLGTIEA